MESIHDMIINKAEPGLIVQRFDFDQRQSENNIAWILDGYFRDYIEDAMTHHRALIVYLLQAETYGFTISEDFAQLILCFAVKEQQIDIVKMTCLRVYSVNNISKNVRMKAGINTPVEGAVITDNAQVLATLLDYADSLYFGRDRTTLPLYVVYHNSWNCLQYLMKRSDMKAYINIPDKDGYTPVLFAAERHPSMIPSLIQWGADVNATLSDSCDVFSRNVLHVLASTNLIVSEDVQKYKFVELAQLLVHAGLDVNSGTAPGGVLDALFDRIKCVVKETPTPDRDISLQQHFILPQQFNPFPSAAGTLVGSDMRECVDFVCSLSLEHDLRTLLLRVVDRMCVFFRPRIQDVEHVSLVQRMANYVLDLARLIRRHMKTPTGARASETAVLDLLIELLYDNHCLNVLTFRLDQNLYQMYSDVIETMRDVITQPPCYRCSADKQQRQYMARLLSYDLNLYWRFLEIYLRQLAVDEKEAYLDGVLTAIPLDSDSFSPELMQRLHTEMRRLWPLRVLCRRALLRSCRPNRHGRISDLPLPRVIIEYLESG